MKLHIALYVTIWMSLVLTITSRNVRNMDALEMESLEERKQEEKEQKERDMTESVPEERDQQISAPEERSQEISTSEERRLRISTSEERDQQISALKERNNEISTSEERRLRISTSEERNQKISTSEERDQQISAPEERNQEISAPEEREYITRTKLDKYMGKHDQTADLMNLGKTALESIGSFAKIDYSQSAEDIAWEVAGAVVPIVSAALALIPGVGVLLSGLFSGLWGVVSSIWAPKKENPMEKMIKQLEEKFNKRLDDKLSNVINLAIHGEISRNVYICNKYNYTYQGFADKFKNRKALEPLEATNLKIYLNDCDNFLKDTSEAFVYDEYAEILWVPGAITTSVRLGFLAELIKNGYLMGMTDEVTLMYIKELRKDTQRQFEYYAKGLKNLNDRHKENNKFNKDTDYTVNVTSLEKASCTLQSQLFYFDRSVYPYGVPTTVLTDMDLFSSVSTADYYNATAFEENKVQHIQILTNASESNFASLPPRNTDADPTYIGYNNPYFALEFINCFLGPVTQKAPSTFWFNFEFLPGNGKYSYEFRVMYLEKTTTSTDTVTYEPPTVPVLHTMTEAVYHRKFPEYEKVQKKINPSVDLTGKTCFGIYFQETKRWDTKEYSSPLVDVFGWSHWKNCPYANFNPKCYSRTCFENTDINTCKDFVSTFQGRFKMHSAGTFNHGNEKLNSLIAIGDPLVDYKIKGAKKKNYGMTNGFIVGMEIIIRPNSQKW